MSAATLLKILKYVSAFLAGAAAGIAPSLSKLTGSSIVAAVIAGLVAAGALHLPSPSVQTASAPEAPSAPTQVPPTI